MVLRSPSGNYLEVQRNLSTCPAYISMAVNADCRHDIVHRLAHMSSCSPYKDLSISDKKALVIWHHSWLHVERVRLLVKQALSPATSD